MIAPGCGALPALIDLIAFLAPIRETDEDRVWGRVLEKLAAALDADAGSHFVHLPKPAQLVARSVVGGAGQSLVSSRIEMGKGLCGWVAKFREPLLIADAYSDSRFLKDIDAASGYLTKTVLAVPLLDRLELVGVIELLNKRTGPFTSDDLACVQAVCQCAILALRGQRLESTVDKVTAHNASILENLGGGFIAVDTHGRIMLCNPAARKILNLPETMPLNDPADQTLMALPAMADILMDTLVKKETVKRRDLPWKHRGEHRVLGYSTLLIQDPRGQIVGAGITFQDITAFQKTS